MENKTSLAIWKNSLLKAEKKFLAIEDEKKTKKELGFALQIFEGSPMLQKCEPSSIVNAVVNVARTSITLNPVLRLCYLIPRGNKCILDISYIGLIKMLKDEGAINYIEAFIVYADEEFEYDVSNSNIHHKIKYADSEDEQKKRKIVGCYSRAILPSNEIVYCYMPNWEVEKVKRMSTNSSGKYSAWTTWAEEMIKKTVIKRHFKLLIGSFTSDRVSALMEIENANNGLKNTFNKNIKPSLSNAFAQEEVIEEVEEEEIDLISDEEAEQIKAEIDYDEPVAEPKKKKGKEKEELF